MMFEKICLICLFLQEQSILSDSTCSSITSYATEGSTINLTFRNAKDEFGWYELYTRNKDTRIFSIVNASKYDIKVHQHVSEFQIINVTASDKGYYWYYWDIKYEIELNITNRSCPSTSNNRICAIAGSSPKLKIHIDVHIYYSTSCTSEWKIGRGVSKITMHPIIQIYNVTLEDEGVYVLDAHVFDEPTRLQLVNLFIVNQTDLKTIVGQEGKEMKIKCSTNTVQYITGLNIESNGSIMAIGDNQSVSFLFIPDRTDHLTTYKCVDITHSSIMTEVKLIIRYAPVVKGRATNVTIECDCNGVPAIYSVYRLDQIAKDGKLVRSVNLNTEKFTFNTEVFPYQNNGRYICFVSNGIPDNNGNVLQTWSTDKKYEGPPVFAPENRDVQKAEVGQSVSLSFYIYSYPEVDKIFINEIGLNSTQRQITKHYSIFTSVLRYTEYNNMAGIQGYEILIDTEVLDIDDFQVYQITAKNSLGKSSYHFTIIDTDLLWFNNQTDINTIVGHEGMEIEIRCSSVKIQFSQALKIESNGKIKAIGDNQSVSYLFIPDRTDHRTKYKCMPITPSSIVAEVKLFIRYGPAVKGIYTNETIKCHSDAVPAVYSVYRLDHISKFGELVRSVNFSDETIDINTDPFPYQKNGKYKCVVSNGIPDTNGTALQSWSTNVKYKGPPVFAPENINLKTGRVGHSITLSFLIYSYPDVGEIVIENIGKKPIKSKQIKHYNILNSTLLYSEYNNIVGIEGYEILIESKVLDLDDFQLYRITAKNRLGDSSYNFAIIDNENIYLNKRNMSYFLILCSIASVLLVYMIILHVCICITHIRKRNKRHHYVEESHNYHTYDEIDTISYRNLRSLDTDENEGEHLLEQHEASMSRNENLQPTHNDTTEMTTDIFDDDLPQQQINDVHRQLQLVSSTLDDTNLFYTDLSQIPSTVISLMENITNCNQTLENANTEASGDQTSQTSYKSDCDTSNNVMVGSIGDEYENNYQSHLYIDIIEDRHNSISSSDSNENEQQRLETGLAKKPVYINLQF